MISFSSTGYLKFFCKISTSAMITGLCNCRYTNSSALLLRTLSTFEYNTRKQVLWCRCQDFPVTVIGRRPPAADSVAFLVFCTSPRLLLFLFAVSTWLRGPPTSWIPPFFLPIPASTSGLPPFPLVSYPSLFLLISCVSRCCFSTLVNSSLA